MVLAMSVETFAFLHVVISLVGIMTGFVVVGLMLQSAPLAGWNAFFLSSTILTSVTDFFFPIKGLTPARDAAPGVDPVHHCGHRRSAPPSPDFVEKKRSPQFYD